MSIVQITRIWKAETNYLLKNIDVIEQEVQDQKDYEREIIRETNSFCPLEFLKKRIINAENIRKALIDNPDDGNVLKAIMCLNNNLLALPPDIGVARSFKIRQYLRNLSQIGGNSTDGYVMTSDVGGKHTDIKKLFVVKFPQGNQSTSNNHEVKDTRDNLIHEYFVGAFGTNSLRSIVPNFAYVFGFFTCSPPYIGSNLEADLPAGTDQTALTYCQNNKPENQVIYIIYEHIAESNTLHQFIKEKASFRDFLSILVQVVLALNEAYSRFDFTHYDLHTENILIRRLPHYIYIPYHVNEEIKYLRTRYLAVIIDFGRSHIKYKDEHFGSPIITAGTYASRSYPIGDIYRLLMTSLLSTLNIDFENEFYYDMTDAEYRKSGVIVNSDILNKIKPLLSYFVPNINPQRYIEYVILARKTYYTLPYIQEYDVSPLHFFENAILAKYSREVNRVLLSKIPEGSPIYGCSHQGTCKSLEEALFDYSEDPLDTDMDPYIFYQTMIELDGSPEGKIRLYGLVLDGGLRYEGYINRLLIDRNIEIIALNSLLSGLQPVNHTINPMSNDFIEQYREYVSQLVQAIDHLTTIILIEGIIQQLNKVYQRKASMLMPNQTYSYAEMASYSYASILPLIHHVNQLIDTVHSDIRYLSGLNFRYSQLSDDNSRWLQRDFPILKQAISKLPTQIYTMDVGLTDSDLINNIY